MRTLLNVNFMHYNNIYWKHYPLYYRAKFSESGLSVAQTNAMLDDRDCLPCRYQLIEDLVSTGDLVSAQSLYEDISDDYRLDERGREDVTAFGIWLNLRMEMETNYTTWTELNSNQRSTLNEIAEHYYTWAGQAAISIINFFMDGHFYIPPAYRTPYELRRQDVLDFSDIHVEVYPIPASNLLNFRMDKVFETADEGTLRLFDSFSKEIYSYNVSQLNSIITIDSREWPAGFYYYSLQITGRESFTGKFEIIH